MTTKSIIVFEEAPSTKCKLRELLPGDFFLLEEWSDGSKGELCQVLSHNQEGSDKVITTLYMNYKQGMAKRTEPYISLKVTIPAKVDVSVKIKV